MTYSIQDDTLTEISVNGIEFNHEMIRQPLGTKISSSIYPKHSEDNLINCANIMFESDDNILSSNQALGWNGLKRIQVIKPTKKWFKCKCGMIRMKDKTDRQKKGMSLNPHRQYSFPIPYPTKHPRNAVIEQVTKVRGGKY